MYNSIMDGFSSYNYYSNMVITNAKTYFQTVKKMTKTSNKVKVQKQHERILLKIPLF